jgi:inorganic pyrophosphatase
MEVRIIGVIAAKQVEDGRTERNDRLLGVSVHSYQHENVTSIKDISRTLVSQIEEFFISYNRQRGEQFKVIGAGGPKKALKLLRAGIRAHREKQAS